MAADLFAHVWGSAIEIERRRRVRLSLWAYAYEIGGSSIVDDATYDREAYASDKSISTGMFDDWWRIFFTPHTGQWIHGHPDLPGIAKLYDRLA